MRPRRWIDRWRRALAAQAAEQRAELLERSVGQALDLLRSTFPDDPELTAALDLLGAAWRQQRPAWLALEFAAIGAEVGRAGELAGRGDMLGCLRLLEALRSKLLRGEAVSAL